MTQTDAQLRAVRGFALPRGRAVELTSGDRVFVREAGPPGATPVVLLHGIGTTAALMWFATLAQLGTEFHVLAPDLRGHGRSPCAGRFHLRNAADDVVALLDALGLERAVLLGYSLGGTVAQLAVRDHPDRVGGLVLSATAARLGPRGVWRVPMKAAAHASSALAGLPLRRAWFRPLADDAEALGGPWAWFAAEMRGCHPQTILEAGGELERFDARPWLGDVDVPSAVIVTRRDRVVPPAAQRHLADRIPHAKIFEIDAGHVAPGMASEVFGPAALAACRWVTAPR